MRAATHARMHAATAAAIAAPACMPVHACRFMHHDVGSSRHAAAAAAAAAAATCMHASSYLARRSRHLFPHATSPLAIYRLGGKLASYM